MRPGRAGSDCLPEPVAQRPAPATDGPLAGKTVVVTGSLTRFTREEINALIHDHGGKPTGSVSKKTSFVVAGTNPGTKLAKAEALKIEIIDEAEYRRRLQGSSGEATAK